MLNDLLLLQGGARRMGIAPAVRHPQVQAPGRVPAIQVRLEAGGGVAAVAALDPDRLAMLWTIRDGNHNAFPFVQMKRPLLGEETGAYMRDVTKKAESGDIRRRLAEAVRDASDWPRHFSETLIARCEERRDAVANIDPASACVPAMLERGAAAMRDAGFARQLAEVILAAEVAGLLGIDGLTLATVALAGDKDGKGAALFFDVEAGFGGGRGQSTTDLRDGRSAHAGNVAAALSASADGGTSGICGLTGAIAPLHEGPFPKPTLPVIGGAYIYARNVEATPASLRYGDKATYPVRRNLPPLLAGTVEALTEAGRQGASWRSVPSEHAKQSDLLLAAVEVDADVAVAGALTGTTVTGEDAEDAEVTVEQVVRTIDAKLAALHPGEAEPQATLVLLRKIDPGNVKAVLSRRLSAAHLRNAAREWADDQSNVPPGLHLPTGKGKPLRGPQRIAPLQLPAVTRVSFLRQGTERAIKPAPGLSPQDAVALFLGDAGAARIAGTALSMILRRQGDLLAATAHARRRGEFGAADNTAALRAVGALGLLLARMDRLKEDYMTGNAYRLGQLFAAADAVHAGYCADVRGGAMPPTLLGNEVLSVAQRSAIRGLDLLARRIRPYQAWGGRLALPAKPNASKEPSQRDRLLRDAYWGMRGMARLSASIDKKRLGEMPDDLARAEMILGYLAGPFEAKNDDRNDEGDDA